MPEALSDSERQLAKKIADLAMIQGWDNAIRTYVREYGVTEVTLRAMLKRALEYNDSADPNGRIPELEDYKKELQGRSQLIGKSQNRFNVRPRAKAPEESSPTDSSSESEQSS